MCHLVKRGPRRPSGIGAKWAEHGIAGKPNSKRVGPSIVGKIVRALTAAVSSARWPEPAGAFTSFAPIPAKSLLIESVRPLSQAEDVWCLTVPGAAEFSLGNGAIVHNCADAFRTLAVGLSNHMIDGKSLAHPQLSGIARAAQSAPMPRQARGVTHGGKPYGYR
jgi:hypothetical protein